MYEACTAGDPVGVICDASHWWYAHHCWINDVILTIMSKIVITVYIYNFGKVKEYGNQVQSLGPTNWLLGGRTIVEQICVQQYTKSTVDST